MPAVRTSVPLNVPRRAVLSTPATALPRVCNGAVIGFRLYSWVNPILAPEILSFTGTPANPELRLSLRRAYRSGDSISVVRSGQLRSVRVLDYVENGVDGGVSGTVTIVPGKVLLEPGIRAA